MNLDYLAIHKEILSWLDMKDYGIDSKEPSIHLQKFMEEFRSIANYSHNLRRFPNEQNRLADYLQGLPSGFHLPFSNFDILKVSKRWGSIDDIATEKQEDKILDGWWNFIACQLLKLERKLSKLSKGGKV